MLATIAWGSVPNWLGAAIILFTAWRLTKGGGGSALAEYERANKRLEQSLKESRLETTQLRTQLARLEGQTNVAIAVSPLLDWTIVHEQRAHERHAALIVVLDLIAERLGPDPNGHPA